MTQSSRELERDAERVRAQLAQTTEQLKEKMTPGQLMDEVVNYFKDGDSSQLLNNLRHQVRDNPMALAMVGAGFAWLMMGHGSAHRTASHDHSAATNGHLRHNGGGLHASKYGAPHAHTVATTGSSASQHSSLSGAATAGSSSGGVASSLKEGASSIRDAASSAASKAGELAGSASESVTASMHDLRDVAGSGMSSMAEAGAAFGQKARNTFMDALEREPLIIGALGIAAGAALGAMLPATRTEQEYLGPLGDQARKAAGETLAEGVEQAKHVAQEVYGAAREEADRQGFTGDKPLSEKVTEVARAAGNELKNAAEDTLGKLDAGEEKSSGALDWASKEPGSLSGQNSPLSGRSKEESGLFRDEKDKPKF